MPVPSRITLQRLREIYARMEFRPREDNPYTFERADGLMFFHSPLRGSEFYWEHVVEDIESTEKFQGLREGLSIEFMAILFNLFEGDG